MRMIVLAVSLLLLVACSSERTTGPQLQQSNTKPAAECEARTGYFVRAGRSYSDADCTVEIPN